MAALVSAPSAQAFLGDESFAEGMKPEASQPEEDPSQLSGGRGKVGRRGEGDCQPQAHMPQPKLLGATQTKVPTASL